MKITRSQFLAALTAPFVAAFLSIKQARKGGFYEVGYMSKGDDTERLQAAINRCRREGQPFYLTNGTYNLSGTLDFTGLSAVCVNSCFFTCKPHDNFVGISTA